MKFTSDGVMISLKAVRRFLICAAILGVVLAFIGLRDAYRQLDDGSSAEAVVTAAICVASMAVCGVTLRHAWLRRRRTRI